MTVFGHRTLKEIIKVKWGYNSGALIQYDLVSLEEEETPGVGTHGGKVW